MSTAPARLPSLPHVQTDNIQLQRWIQAVSERLEVREGSRGNEDEKVVLQRDLKTLGLDASQFGVAGRTRSGNAAGGSVLVQIDGGVFSRVPMDAFADELRKTRLYRDLMLRIDDVTRFDDIPDQVKSILLTSIADEAAQRGADIRRMDTKIQSATESLAYSVQEITAAVGSVSSGIREVQFASASANSSTAGKVTQLDAAIMGTSAGPGETQGQAAIRARIEESLTVTASKVTGANASYMMKVQAGGAQGAFGISATAPVNGVSPSSTFLVAANRFALIDPSTYVPGAAIDTARIPFGYDSATNTIYINGQVRINTGGSDLTTLAANASVPAITYIGEFLNAPSTSGRKKNQVYKNTTDKNTYILLSDGGVWAEYLTSGTPGLAGARGSITAYATGWAWSDNTAASAIAAATGSSVLRIGDTVTISSIGFAATRYWGGSAWLDPGVVIDGNLLVSGTVSADKISAGTITAQISLNSVGYMKVGGTEWNFGGVTAGEFNASTKSNIGVTGYSGLGLGAGVQGVASFGNQTTYGVVGVAQQARDVAVRALNMVAGGNALEAIGNSTFNGNVTITGALAATVTNATNAVNAINAVSATNASNVGGILPSQILTNGGSTAGNPGTAFTHTLNITCSGVTVRVPCFYP